jgi:hypothetical protein
MYLKNAKIDDGQENLVSQFSNIDYICINLLRKSTPKNIVKIVLFGIYLYLNNILIFKIMVKDSP